MSSDVLIIVGAVAEGLMTATVAVYLYWTHRRLTRATNYLSRAVTVLRGIQKDFAEGLALQKDLLDFLDQVAAETEQEDQPPPPPPVRRVQKPQQQARPTPRPLDAAPLEEEDDDDFTGAGPGVPLDAANPVMSRRERNRL